MVRFIIIIMVLIMEKEGSIFPVLRKSMEIMDWDYMSDEMELQK